jgi:hypothetical protein
MTLHHGRCHCGNIELAFATSIDPQEIEIRACQCSFCRKHGSRAAADAAGMLSLFVADETQVSRYRFGLETAEYWVCRACGVYVAAITTGESQPRGIVIVNALDDDRLFTRAPVAVDYDAESRAVRIARRRARWMPVEVQIAGAAAPQL